MKKLAILSILTNCFLAIVYTYLFALVCVWVVGGDTHYQTNTERFRINPEVEYSESLEPVTLFILESTDQEYPDNPESVILEGIGERNRAIYHLYLPYPFFEISDYVIEVVCEEWRVLETKIIYCDNVLMLVPLFPLERTPVN